MYYTKRHSIIVAGASIPALPADSSLTARIVGRNAAGAAVDVTHTIPAADFGEATGDTMFDRLDLAICRLIGYALDAHHVADPAFFRIDAAAPSEIASVVAQGYNVNTAFAVAFSSAPQAGEAFVPSVYGMELTLMAGDGVTVLWHRVVDIDGSRWTAPVGETISGFFILNSELTQNDVDTAVQTAVDANSTSYEVQLTEATAYYQDSLQVLATSVEGA